MDFDRVRSWSGGGGVRITEFTTALVRQLGVRVPRVVLVDGCSAECTDAYLLDLIYGGKLVGTLLYRSDLENLEKGLDCSCVEKKGRGALLRLDALCRHQQARGMAGVMQQGLRNAEVQNTEMPVTMLEEDLLVVLKELLETSKSMTRGTLPSASEMERYQQAIVWSSRVIERVEKSQ